MGDVEEQQKVKISRRGDKKKRKLGKLQQDGGAAPEGAAPKRQKGSGGKTPDQLVAAKEEARRQVQREMQVRRHAAARLAWFAVSCQQHACCMVAWAHVDQAGALQKTVTDCITTNDVCRYWLRS